jgi:hypothetical protein
MRKVKFDFNSTRLAEFDVEWFDNYKGGNNHIVNSYNGKVNKYNYFIPFYFYNPEDHDWYNSGI